MENVPELAVAVLVGRAHQPAGSLHEHADERRRTEVTVQGQQVRQAIYGLRSDHRGGANGTEDDSRQLESAVPEEPSSLANGDARLGRLRG